MIYCFHHTEHRPFCWVWVSAAVAIAGVFPAVSHDPIRYSFGVVSYGDTPEARALMTFLAGPEAQAIFVARGFMVE